MFEEHISFVRPKNTNTIWRYMDFEKFVHLIVTKQMYFCRADLLGDSYEGSYPASTLAARDEHFKNMGYSESLKGTLKALSKVSRKQMYINCWHMNENESDAMWKLYSSKGIAIKTTIKRLQDCFANTSERIFIGKVFYRDYTKKIWPGFIKTSTAIIEAPPYGGGFETILSKRLCFKHEKELRCIIWKPYINEKNEIDLSYDKMAPGCNIDIDLECLVETVYITPTMNPWFKELVENVIQKYGYSFKVKHSELSEGPVF